MIESLSEWSAAVRDRDGQRCAVCGGVEKVQAHHIIPKSAAPQFSLVLANGISLCFSCHELAHKTAVERGLLMRPQTGGEELAIGGNAYRLRCGGYSWTEIWCNLDPLKIHREPNKIRYFAQRYAADNGLAFPPEFVKTGKGNGRAWMR